MNTTREEVHTLLMKAVCEAVSVDNKPLILKGGTALLLCYGLDRFSEDLDFDLEHPIATHMNVESLCQEAVKRVNKRGLRASLEAFSEPKKTETTHRCRPVFKVAGHAAPFSIKIEISARETPAPDEITHVNDVKVYSPDRIARMKLLAATQTPDNQGRTAARDLHDLAFLATHYEGAMPNDVMEDLKEFFADPGELLIRYADAYEADPILKGRIYEDLAAAERWVEDRREHNLRRFSS